MHKKGKERSAALYIAGGAAILIALALILFFGWMLALRSAYHRTALEINERVLASSTEQNFVRRGGDAAPLSDEALEYYSKFLLDQGTAVFDRKGVEPTEKSIELQIGDCALTFSDLGDGAVNLRWETPEATTYYSVRSYSGTFTRLSSYLTTYFRGLEK